MKGKIRFSYKTPTKDQRWGESDGGLVYAGSVERRRDSFKIGL